MDSKKIVLLALLSMVFLGLTAQGNAQAAPVKTIQVKSGDHSFAIEVGEIKKGENGFPSLTIQSTAISGSISMSASEMVPFVACAVLDNGDVVDPILLAGGLGKAGYTIQSPKPLIKDTADGRGGQWKSQGGSGKGYLKFSFSTDKSIKKIIVGSYAEYAKSNYKSFVSVDQTYP